MAVYSTPELKYSLVGELDRITDRAARLKTESIEVLNQQPLHGGWSVAQVLEHLNSYNRYYLPAIEKAIRVAGAVSSGETFRPGWLGDYFTRSMYSTVATKGTVSNKMKAPKDHVPAPAQDVTKVLTEFMAGTQRLKQLIIDMTGKYGVVRVPISIAPLLKIKLGDTFRFLVAHQVRHFLQIDNTLLALAQRSA